jgi:hypothetical protein
MADFPGVTKVVWGARRECGGPHHISDGKAVRNNSFLRRRSPMKRFVLPRSTRTLALSAALAVSVVLPAAAQWHGPGHPPPHWHGNYHGNYHSGPNTGAIVGGALLGLGVGAAIGALAAPPPAYYAPPPVYYGAPPPAYYAAPPPVYYGY